jgi:tetratricopeptide (TPR) repeat protein
MDNFTPKYHFQISGSNVVAGDGNTINILSKPGQPAPYMLPEGRADFTGREDYIAEVEGILNRGKIVAIDGMAGVGKSELAIHVANRLKDRFPDAQLYINLLGQTPELTLEPKTVLIRFIQALTGWDESQMLTDLDGLVAQYRSVLTDKRVLVVLDNARDEAQVRLLLPSSQDCAVLITSRNRLTGLSGAELVDLKPMLTKEAALLFQRVLNDSNRANAEPATVGEIVNLCGRLPIAIRIAAATLTQLIWKEKSLAVYAKELAAEETRLSKLENENVEQSIPGQGKVRASFNLSYRALAAEAQQLFRWAGGLPGVDFGLQVLAAVMEQQESQIEVGLGRLIEAQVLELSRERFSFHDLMRLFAREQLTEPERETVLDRSLTWYCQKAGFWNQALNPVQCRQLAQELTAQTGDSAEKLEQLLPIRALDWFATERKNWVEIVRKLTQIPRPDDAVALAGNLASFFQLRSIWDDWVTTHEMVKDCAQEAGNLFGVTQTLSNLGLVYDKQGKWAEAIELYQQSIDISHQLGDSHSIAETFNKLGIVYDKQGKWDEAISLYQQSVEIFRQLGDIQGVAQAFCNWGNIYQNQNKWDRAEYLYQQSVDIYHQLGDIHGVAQTLGNLGTVYHNQGRWDEAIFRYQQSVEIFHQLGDIHGVAQTLGNLGNVYYKKGKLDRSEHFYQQSLKTFSQLGDPYGVAQTLCSLGLVFQNQSKWDEAISFYQQSVEIFRQLGDPYSVSQVLNNLGNLHSKYSKWDEAIKSYQQSVEISRKLGDTYSTGKTLGNLGLIHKQLNQLEQAQAIWREALTYFHPSSPEFQTVQQWLETSTPPIVEPRNVNYLLPLAIGGLILFCLVKGFRLLAIFGVGTILF